MNDSRPKQRPHGVRWWVGGLLVAGALLALYCADFRHQQMPVWTIQAASSRNESDRCAACHEAETASYRNAPHRHTLHSAADPVVAERFSDVELRLSDRLRYAYRRTEDGIWFSSSRYPEPILMDWVFGSGRHAQTPVSIWNNPAGKMELLEHRVSWYPEGGVGLTLGHSPQDTPREGLEMLGKWHPHAEAMRCLGCHATHLPTSGDARASPQIVPGVGCVRCHYQAVEHAAAMERGSDPVRIERLAELSPLESVQRCGECHRRADQFPPDERIETNVRLVRFASVGLVLSHCFLRQAKDAARPHRLDCITCHDPHEPARRDAAHYRTACLACHGGSTPVECPNSPRDSNCLTCHMPKVAVQSSLQFTDHWIRRPRQGQ